MKHLRLFEGFEDFDFSSHFPDRYSLEDLQTLVSRYPNADYYFVSDLDFSFGGVDPQNILEISDLEEFTSLILSSDQPIIVWLYYRDYLFIPEDLLSSIPQKRLILFGDGESAQRQIGRKAIQVFF
jgi:hypothetical protein